MKCYFSSNENKENSILVSQDEIYIFEHECPENAITKGNQLKDKYEIIKTKFWECCATSDNGIDDRQTDNYTYEILFENLVFDGEAFIGVYLSEPQQILSFTDERKSSITVITEEKFVGGWGEITEGYSYCLSEKK